MLTICQGQDCKFPPLFPLSTGSQARCARLVSLDAGFENCIDATARLNYNDPNSVRPSDLEPRTSNIEYQEETPCAHESPFHSSLYCSPAARPRYARKMRPRRRRRRPSKRPRLLGRMPQRAHPRPQPRPPNPCSPPRLPNRRRRPPPSLLRPSRRLRPRRRLRWLRLRPRSRW